MSETPTAESDADCNAEPVTMLGWLIPASEVRVGDEIATATYCGTVVQIDTYEIGWSGGAPWPCLRILIGGKGGVARFPQELVLVEHGVRESSTVVREQQTR